jgi:hypothetical protein
MLEVWEAPRLNAKKRLPDSVISHSINMAIYKGRTEDGSYKTTTLAIPRKLNCVQRKRWLPSEARRFIHIYMENISAPVSCLDTRAQKGYAI